MEGHLDGIQMHLDDLTRRMGDTNSRVGDLTGCMGDLNALSCDFTGTIGGPLTSETSSSFFIGWQELLTAMGN